MKRTSIYLTARQIESLAILSASHGLTQAEMVRRAVDAFLASNEESCHGNKTGPNGSRVREVDCLEPGPE